VKIITEVSRNNFYIDGIIVFRFGVVWYIRGKSHCYLCRYILLQDHSKTGIR